jgi:LysM repeat protein
MVSPIITMRNWEKHSGVSGIPTQLLVLHSGESPLRGGFAQSLTSWANIPLALGGPEASWHWFIDPIAIVSQIDPNYAAWHASEANPISEGFEQAGYARFSRAEWLTPEGLKQLDNLAWIMAQRAKANNIPPVWLTNAQVVAACAGNRAIKGFCTHRQIDPETRTDPGNGYPYDLLLAKVKAYMGIKPPAAPVVPASTKPVTKPAPAVPKPRVYPDSDIHWVVGKGDTLGKIQKYYGGPTVAQIAAYNNINPNQIKPGQKIWIPGPLVWVIEAPDTLRSVARYYGLDPAYLARLNGLPGPDATIYIGNRLIIKK